MKHLTPSDWLFALLSLVAVFCPVSVRAIQIDFDAGYTQAGAEPGSGHLDGQPSTGTRWSVKPAGASALLVTAGDGAKGNDQAVRTQEGHLSQYVDYSFAPTAEDLGAPLDAASSKVTYSFQLKLNGNPSSGTKSAFRLHIGAGKIANFDLLDNGAFVISEKKEGKSQLVFSTKAEGDAAFFRAPANNYFTISGDINFATKTFTVSVNGVAQKFNGGLNFDFFDATADSVALDLIDYTAPDPNWVSVSLDNIVLMAGQGQAPQPSSSKVTPTSLTSGPELSKSPTPDGQNLIQNSSFENPLANIWWHQNNWAKNEVEWAWIPRIRIRAEFPSGSQ